MVKKPIFLKIFENKFYYEDNTSIYTLNLLFFYYYLLKLIKKAI